MTPCRFGDTLSEHVPRGRRFMNLELASGAGDGWRCLRDPQRQIYAYILGGIGHVFWLEGSRTALWSCEAQGKWPDVSFLLLLVRKQNWNDAIGCVGHSGSFQTSVLCHGKKPAFLNSDLLQTLSEGQEGNCRFRCYCIVMKSSGSHISVSNSEFF